MAGKWYGVILSAENKKQFLISEGFAHGFLVLSDEAEFCYKVNDFWHPNDEGGMAWNDPEIGIEWPELKGEYKGSASAEGYTLEDGTVLNLSDKDQKWLKRCVDSLIEQSYSNLEIVLGKDYTFDEIVVALFCVYFYLVTMQQVNGMYKDAAGVWHQDRFRPLIAAMANLFLNIILVQFWGIYAILLSTIMRIFLLMGIMARNHRNF